MLLGRMYASVASLVLAYTVCMKFPRVWSDPYREYAVISVLALALAYYYLLHGSEYIVLIAAILGSVMPLIGALKGVLRRKITIEVFNFFALVVSFATGEFTSAAFIALMLTVAEWLDWKTDSRATSAVEALLALKPTRAVREIAGQTEDIDTEAIREGDILIVRTGDRIPADGVVVFGSGYVNESSLTGESRPIAKACNAEVFSSTIVESGIVKIRATKVGKDSTLERLAELIRDAAKNKSRAERLADRFAGIFLPIVLVGGVVLYLVTGNIVMTAALFLVVCADDIAVSIPLAITASLGFAAKRGVIIKGGEWLQALATVDTLVFDKTGTITHGTFALASSVLEPTTNEALFWRLVGAVEKYSEHPVGRALYAEAQKHTETIPDPEQVQVQAGAGIYAQVEGHVVSIGSTALCATLGHNHPHSADVARASAEARQESVALVCIDGVYAGCLGVADTIKEEAHDAFSTLRAQGITLRMLTGDHEEAARAVATTLGIDSYRADMKPEAKLEEIEALAAHTNLAMIGDGVNDAPALARADVGIAMGAVGTAVAVQAANIVILTDRLDRIPEMILLSRRTMSVVHMNIAIWVLTNVVGIALVLTGFAGPVLAAIYNLVTDFFPLLNSARLFRTKLTKP